VDKRIFGLRNEYSVVLSASGPRQLSPHEVLSPQEVRRRLFGPVVSGGLSRSVPLRNGGQLYLDVVGHPEYATPDCGNALDLVVHDKAGERILEGLLEDAGQRLREEGIAGDISVLKSNAGPAGSSYGCQENYVVGRRAEFGRLADILIPHQAAHLRRGHDSADTARRRVLSQPAHRAHRDRHVVGDHPGQAVAPRPR
jgi:proteasome accessory factor A